MSACKKERVKIYILYDLVRTGWDESKSYTINLITQGEDFFIFIFHAKRHNMNFYYDTNGRIIRKEINLQLTRNYWKFAIYPWANVDKIFDILNLFQWCDQNVSLIHLFFHICFAKMSILKENLQYRWYILLQIVIKDKDKEEIVMEYKIDHVKAFEINNHWRV